MSALTIVFYIIGSVVLALGLLYAVYFAITKFKDPQRKKGTMGFFFEKVDKKLFFQILLDQSKIKIKGKYPTLWCNLIRYLARTDDTWTKAAQEFWDLSWIHMRRLLVSPKQPSFKCIRQMLRHLSEHKMSREKYLIYEDLNGLYFDYMEDENINLTDERILKSIIKSVRKDDYMLQEELLKKLEDPTFEENELRRVPGYGVEALIEFALSYEHGWSPEASTIILKAILKHVREVWHTEDWKYTKKLVRILYKYPQKPIKGTMDRKDTDMLKHIRKSSKISEIILRSFNNKQNKKQLQRMLKYYYLYRPDVFVSFAYLPPDPKFSEISSWFTAVINLAKFKKYIQKDTLAWRFWEDSFKVFLNDHTLFDREKLADIKIPFFALFTDNLAKYSESIFDAVCEFIEENPYAVEYIPSEFIPEVYKDENVSEIDLSEEETLFVQAWAFIITNVNDVDKYYGYISKMIAQIFKNEMPKTRPYLYNILQSIYDKPRIGMDSKKYETVLSTLKHLGESKDWEQFYNRYRDPNPSRLIEDVDSDEESEEPEIIEQDLLGLSDTDTDSPKPKARSLPPTTAGLVIEEEGDTTPPAVSPEAFLLSPPRSATRSKKDFKYSIKAKQEPKVGYDVKTIAKEEKEEESEESDSEYDSERVTITELPEDLPAPDPQYIGYSGFMTDDEDEDSDDESPKAPLIQKIESD